MSGSRHRGPRLLLINPIQTLEGRRQRGWNGHRYVPPLALAYVGALTPADWQVRILDENAGDDACREVSWHPDFVGISAYTATVPRAYELAALYRSQGAAVAIGGSHASALPDEVLQYADCAFVGDAEGAWPRVTRDFEAGALRPCYNGDHAPLAGMVLPRRDLYPHRYLFDAVVTSKGCPHRCEFCSVWRSGGRSYRTRPVGEVVAELGQMPSRRVFFVDDSFATDSGRATELCRAMVDGRLGKRFAVQASLEIGDHPELLRWLRRAGCFLVLVGVESVDEVALRQMRKAANLRLGVGRYGEMVRAIQSHGMAVSAGVIFGADAETDASRAAVLRFVREARVDSPVYTLLTPLPGTDLWDRLRAEGRLATGPLPEGYSRLDAHHVAFAPEGISAAALTEANRAAVLEATSLWRLIAGTIGTLWRTRSLLATLASLRNNLWARQNLPPAPNDHLSAPGEALKQVGPPT